MKPNLSAARLITLLFPIHLTVATHHHGAIDQQQLPLDPPDALDRGVPYIFRDAGASDIDDITTVVLDAFGPSLQTQYVYQFRDQYPEYHRECVRRSVASQLAQIDPDETAVKVISVYDPHRASEGAVASRVVALGIWNFVTSNNGTQARKRSTSGDLSGVGLLGQRLQEGGTPGDLTPGRSGIAEDKKGGFNCSAHLDLNITRALDVQRKFDEAKKTYIDDVYDRHVYLSLLATHPDWDGNGFGAANCEWGMALARGRAENVTLVATPAGFPLYRSLGFASVKNVTIEMFDGLGTLWYEVMNFDPTAA